jgi:hypothetical protein
MSAAPQTVQVRIAQQTGDVKHATAFQQHRPRRRMGHIEGEILVFQAQRDSRRDVAHGAGMPGCEPLTTL